MITRKGIAAGLITTGLAGMAASAYMAGVEMTYVASYYNEAQSFGLHLSDMPAAYKAGTAAEYGVAFGISAAMAICGCLMHTSFDESRENI